MNVMRLLILVVINSRFDLSGAPIRNDVLDLFFHHQMP